MKIRVKIFLFIFITSFVVFTLVIGFIIFDYRNYSVNEATEQTKVFANHAATFVKGVLEKDLAVCATLADGLADYKKIEAANKDKIFEDMLENILEKHNEYLSIGISWELSHIDDDYGFDYGRRRTVAVREEGTVKFYIDTVEVFGDSYGSPYYNSKKSGLDILVDPYYYVYSQSEGGDSILETSIAKPTKVDGEFVGIVGVDITLDRFDYILEQIKPSEGSKTYLVSNNSSIISSHDKKNVSDSLVNVFPKFEEFGVREIIKSGKPYSFNYTDPQGLSNFVSFEPVVIGNSPTSWSVCIIIPYQLIQSKTEIIFARSIIVGLIGIFIFSLITLLIANRLTLPLKRTTSILKDMDRGVIDVTRKLKVRSKDELAEMGRSLNNLLDTLQKTTEFARQIGEGNFNAQYQALSDEDVLGNALIDMQKNLQEGQELEEIRVLERRKLNWAQEGLTELSEVLRTSTDDFEEYLLLILSYILKYLKADQGAIFLLNTSDPKHPFLELRSAYAYDKKKALEAKLEIGESLVGRCFQEKEIIFLTNIPEGYTFVSSGLGGHEPRCLFLMPLLFEDEPFGVIEIASFRELADFEIEFLKTIGERVASSISVMEKNVQTKQLLDQYQVQSEELQNRESMLQENLQELQNLQEDAAAKEKETVGIVDALSNIGSIVWYDMQGNIQNIKDENLRELGYAEKDLIGKNQSEFAREAKESPEKYKQFWENLRAGKQQRRIFSTETRKGRIWISEIYTPIVDNDGNYIKVINIGFDITEQKLLEQKIEKLQQKLDKLKK